MLSFKATSVAFWQCTLELELLVDTVRGLITVNAIRESKHELEC